MNRTAVAHDREFRENVIRFLMGETGDFLGVFGKEYGLHSERTPVLARDEIKPPLGPAKTEAAGRERVEAASIRSRSFRKSMMISNSTSVNASRL